MDRKIVGLTGGYCAGKNEVASVLEEHDWHVIDVDRVGHTSLEMEKERIVENFGHGVIAVDGGIDRKKLGSIVFAEKKKLQTLEGIVHPRMVEIVRREAEECVERGTPVCINAALLFKMGLDSLCSHVLMVRAPFLVRFRRARNRDGLGFFEFLRRIASQRALFPKKKGKDVDMYTVWNSSDRRTLRFRIEECIKLIERQG